MLFLILDSIGLLPNLCLLDIALDNRPYAGRRVWQPANQGSLKRACGVEWPCEARSFDHTKVNPASSVNSLSPAVG